jgi:hypothetical protein
MPGNRDKDYECLPGIVGFQLATRILGLKDYKEIYQESILLNNFAD